MCANLSSRGQYSDTLLGQGASIYAVLLVVFSSVKFWQIADILVALTNVTLSASTALLLFAIFT